MPDAAGEDQVERPRHARQIRQPRVDHPHLRQARRDRLAERRHRLGRRHGVAAPGEPCSVAPTAGADVQHRGGGRRHVRQRLAQHVLGRQPVELLAQRAGVGGVCRDDVVAHASTPVSRPACSKAARPSSMSRSVSAAFICVRIRALPLGTTGKKNPVT